MDLSTSYLGLRLDNPLVPSASPLSRRLDTLKRIEDQGASAVVLYSLFEEEILVGDLALHEALSLGAESYSEALSYLPEALYYQTGPEAYLEHLRRVKDSLSIPVIASLNGITTGGWTRYARDIESVGADALELNMYYLPSDPHLSGSVVEEMYAGLLAEVRGSITLPIAVKLSPFFSSLPHMSRRLAGAGAQGLVLFNRFYQPDIDIESLSTQPTLELSSSSELRLPLRWIALLFGNVAVDLALTTGVHTAEDVLKGLMAGASVTMIASELLRNGVQRIGEILDELRVWLEVHEYESLAPLVGSMSVVRSSQSAAFERANYLSVLRSYRPDSDLPSIIEAL